MTVAAPERTLSWLLLEQYVLGELDEAAVRMVEARLAVSATDREKLQVIRSDSSALPPLTLHSPADERVASSSLPRGRRVPWLGLGGVLAAAAAWALLLPASVEKAPGARHTLKGGEELSLRVVSERGRDAVSFEEGERFKLLVTCPPAWTGALDVVVFQAGQRFAPLEGGAGVVCGNSVPWPGAFSLDGSDDVHVCVAPAAAAEAAKAPEALADEGVCVHLPPRR